MRSVLITGANRGLGLEFASQYAADGWRVFACCRRPDAASELGAIAAASDGRLIVHTLDVADRASIDSLAAALRGEAIDVLINNAAVIGGRDQRFGGLDWDEWTSTLRTNVMGPTHMLEAFADHVAASDKKAAVTVTSGMGSIADTSGGQYVYRTSKAAVNMAMRSASKDLAGRAITVAVIHPGWVRTDMGGSGADLSPSESVSGMRRVIDGQSAADNGKFLDHAGREHPW